MKRVRLSLGLRVGVSAMFGMLCLLQVALWVRSYYFMDRGSGTAFGKSLWIQSSQGRFLFEIESAQARVVPSRFISILINDVTDPGISRWWYHEKQSVGSAWAYVGMVPHALLVVLFTTAAASLWIKWRFSLRTLLIAKMFVALLLGALVLAVK